MTVEVYNCCPKPTERLRWKEQWISGLTEEPK